jgi:hypothetical protein
LAQVIRPVQLTAGIGAVAATGTATLQAQAPAGVNK